MNKLMLIPLLLAIFAAPAFAVSLPYPAFTNITDLGSPACGIDYTDINYFQAMAIDQDETYWTAVRRECGGSYNGILGIFKSTDNGATFQDLGNYTFCTGDSGSAADLDVFSVQNEIYVMTFCASPSFTKTLFRLNKTDGSIISSVGLGGQARCSSNSTNIWCIATPSVYASDDIYLKLYDKDLNLMNNYTCSLCRPDAEGSFSLQLTSEDFLEYIYWNGDNYAAYYGNVTSDGNFSNLTSTGFNARWHIYTESFIVMPDGIKLITGRIFYPSDIYVANSSDGISWSINAMSISSIHEPHIMKYNDDIILFYSNGTAANYVKSNDSGATWESAVTIADTPSQDYTVSSRGQNFPDYNNYTAHANYIDFLIGSQENNNVFFVPMLLEDVLAPEIAIQSPVGNVLSTFNINFTIANEVGSMTDQCWYDIDFGSNVSLPSCSNASASLPIGNYSITIYANDTSGNMGSNASSFSIPPDTNPPVVAIQSPSGNYTVGNETYYVLLDFNFTAEDETAVDSCWISINGGIGYYSCANISGIIFVGNYNVTVFANDTSGNTGNASVNINIFDSTSPIVSVQSPTGTVTSPFNMQFIVSDNVAIDSCWYDMDAGSNVSIPSCSNFTDSNSLGDHNVTFYVNDTSGNIGSAISPFTVIAAPLPPPITGSAAVVVGLLPLFGSIFAIFAVLRRIEGAEDVGDIILLVVGALFVVVFVGVLAAVVAGLI
jgi:hypothetical protein